MDEQKPGPDEVPDNGESPPEQQEPAPRKVVPIRPIIQGHGPGKRRRKGEKPRRPRRSTREVLRKEQWFKMTAFFDSVARVVMKVNEENVLLCGWVPPDMDCAIVLVPTSVTHEQGLALQKLIEGNVRKPVVVLTNNTQLVRLKPIPDNLAAEIMKGRADEHDSIIQVTKEDKEAERSAESGEGGGLRAEDRGGDAGDLRPAESDSGAGQVSAVETAELDAPSDAPEGEQGSAVGSGQGGEGA